MIFFSRIPKEDFLNGLTIIIHEENRITKRCSRDAKTV